MKNTKRAFRWIVDLLRKNHVPFRLTGGFAARIYGAKRPLADIDLDVPEAAMSKIAPLVKEHIVAGPCRYKDEEWDLFVLSLKYCGQEIDLCGAESQRIHDKSARRWVSLTVSFVKSPMKNIFGMRVRVIPKSELITYKSKIKRDVDILDVSALTAFSVKPKLPPLPSHQH